VEYQYYQQEHYQHHGGEHQVHSEGESEEVDPLAETGLFIPGTEVNGGCAMGARICRWAHAQGGEWLPRALLECPADHLLLRLLLPLGAAAWQHPPPCPAPPACLARPPPEP
jgi:hypothetical protein